MFFVFPNTTENPAQWGHNGELSKAFADNSFISEAVEDHVAQITDDDPQCLTHETSHIILPIGLTKAGGELKKLAYQESWAAECLVVGMEIGVFDQLGQRPVTECADDFKSIVKDMAFRGGSSLEWTFDHEEYAQLNLLTDDNLEKIWDGLVPAFEFFEAEKAKRDAIGSPSDFDSLTCELMMRDLYKAVFDEDYPAETMAAGMHCD